MSASADIVRLSDRKKLQFVHGDWEFMTSLVQLSGLLDCSVNGVNDFRRVNVGGSVWAYKKSVGTRETRTVYLLRFTIRYADSAGVAGHSIGALFTAYEGYIRALTQLVRTFSDSGFTLNGRPMKILDALSNRDFMTTWNGPLPALEL